MDKGDKTFLHLIPDIMAIQAQLFGSFMENWVFRNVNDSLVVIMQGNRKSNADSEITQ